MPRLDADIPLPFLPVDENFKKTEEINNAKEYNSTIEGIVSKSAATVSQQRCARERR
jgi:hypothetical protein